MFTGIIQDIGQVLSLCQDTGGDRRYVIETQLDLSQEDLGASIACNGCCLTVVEKGEDWFAVEVSQESLDKTLLSIWEEGTPINLEPALRMGGALGGHIVSGHVDGLARLMSVTPDEGSHSLRFAVPDAFSAFIAPKGSITLNGISLTVNDVEGSEFTVNIIPHTWTHTTMNTLQPGDDVQFEVDMLARYVVKAMQERN